MIRDGGGKRMEPQIIAERMEETSVGISATPDEWRIVEEHGVREYLI